MFLIFINRKVWTRIIWPNPRIIPLLLLYILLSTSSSISDRRTDRTWVVTVHANTSSSISSSELDTTLWVQEERLLWCIMTSIKTTVYHHFNSNKTVAALLIMVKICQLFNKQPLITFADHKQICFGCKNSKQWSAKMKSQKLWVLNDQGLRHHFQNNPINLSAIKQEVQIVPIFKCVSTWL